MQCPDGDFIQNKRVAVDKTVYTLFATEHRSCLWTWQNYCIVSRFVVISSENNRLHCQAMATCTITFPVRRGGSSDVLLLFKGLISSPERVARISNSKSGSDTFRFTIIRDLTFVSMPLWASLFRFLGSSCIMCSPPLYYTIHVLTATDPSQSGRPASMSERASERTTLMASSSSSEKGALLHSDKESVLAASSAISALHHVSLGSTCSLSPL